MIQAIAQEFSELQEDEVLVFMGHGTTHYANSVYAALDYMFKDLGHKNIFLGTVEAYPSMQSLLRMVKEYSPKKVILAPFMIVAGDHPESWLCQFQECGFEVMPVLKGLGQYSAVRQMFIDHIREALEH